MEAVPRLPMLSCEMKTSPSNTEFGPPLKKYIAEYYHEDPENYNKEIKEIESLRISACKVPRDFTGIRILKRYFAQLICLQSRFPMSEDGEASVVFVWSDIYSGMSFNITDVRYEEACILYNIGALHSELGANDKRANAEGMKVACTHFQCAAWAFQHLRDNYPQPKGSDMSQDLLSCFITLMLAQAQECILEKSMLDSRKSTITAKVAAQVVEYYRSTLNVLLLGSSSGETGCILDIIKTKMFKHLEKFLEFKIAYYTSIAHLYMGNQAEEQQLMGERVAWFQSSLEKHEEAVKLSKHLNKEDLMEALTFTLDVIGGKCNAAKKENEFVYHEKVLPTDSLPEIKGASLVKGVPFSPHDPDVCGPDIFARLVPMETHEASSLYSEEKAKLLRDVSAKIQKKEEELVTFLSSVQLDRNSLVPKMDQLPEELIERCAALSVKPNAIDDVKASLNTLLEVCHEVEMSIHDAKTLLAKDEEREKQHQEMFGKRPPNLITVELSKELSKYEMAHKKAIESNATLQKALEIHLSYIQLLQSPLDELHQKIPSISISQIPNGQEVVNELETLFDKVEEMKSQRKLLEMQLREATHNDDITKLLVTRDKKDSLSKIFSDQLRKHETTLGYLEQNLNAQDNIFRAFINAISRYAETRKILGRTLSERDLLIENLMKSYDAYDDLVLKTQKGIDFYRKLQTNVQRLQARVKSVTSVQEEERTQISQAHTKKISKQPTSIPVPNLSAAVPPSTTPKLKDYLPYMTGRLGSAVPPTQQPSAWTPTPEPSNISSLSSQPLPSSIPTNSSGISGGSYTTQSVTDSIPMGIRPAPVGSEQTNTGSCSTSAYNTNISMSLQNSTEISKYGSKSHNYYSQYGYSMDSGYDTQNIQPSYAYNYATTVPSTTISTTSYYQVPTSQYYSQPPSTTYVQPATPDNRTYSPQIYSNSASPAVTGDFQYPNQYSNSIAMSTYGAAQVSTTSQHSTSYPATVPATSTVVGLPYQSNIPAASTVSGGTYPATSSPYHTYYGSSDTAKMGYTLQPDSSQIQSTYQQYTSVYTPTVTTVSNSQPIVSQSYQAPLSSYSTTSTSNYNVAAQESYGYGSTGAYSNQTDSLKTQYGYTQPQSYQTQYSNIDQQTVNQYQQYNYTQDQKPTSQEYGTSQTYQHQMDYTQYGSNSNQTYQQENVPSNYTTPALTPQSYQTELSGLLPLQPTPALQLPQPVIENKTATQPIPAQSPNMAQIAPKTTGSGSQSSVSSGHSSVTSSPAHVATTISVSNKDFLESLVSDIPDTTVRPVLQPKTVPLTELQKDKTDVDIQQMHLKDPLSDKNILEKFVIEVDKFKKVVEGLTKKSLNGPTPLDQKWKEVTDTQDKESRKRSISVARCYPLKNRVPDIMPYDSNRIEIQSLKDDYINASYINDLSPTSPKFIVTQAPLPSTFTDFWVMVWEQQVEVVVCLVANAELKGHIYWPTERGHPLEFGTLSLNLQSFKECQYFNEFMINITQSETKISRVVIFLQFFTWPPGAQTSNPAIILQFISEVHNYHRQQRNLQRPIVVHCLSGVGRSGVFCLLSASMKELSLGGNIPDLSLMAAKGNQQRKFLIQEKDQLKFSHEAALYYAQDILVKRGILSNKTTFDEKIPKVRTHTRHPSEDFILGGIKIEKSSSLDSETKSVKSETETDSKTSLTSIDKQEDKDISAIESLATEMTLKDESETEQRPSSCPVVRTDDSMMSGSRRSSAASYSSSVTSILDPANFNLDTGVSSKKKFTRESFKNPLGLGQLNASGGDPLSMLDPLWSLKKE